MLVAIRSNSATDRKESIYCQEFALWICMVKILACHARNEGIVTPTERQIRFRRTRARCMGWTVNPWLGEFESHIRSQVSSGASYNGSTTDFDSVSLGSIPSVPSISCWTSGLGHHPFKVTRRVRFPYRIPFMCEC